MTIKMKAAERLIKFSKNDAGTYPLREAPELHSSPACQAPNTSNHFL